MSVSFVRFEKPWGWELVWEVMPSVLGRVVHVTRGHRMWLESPGATEELVLCSGLLTLVWEDDRGHLQEQSLGPGQVHTIPVRSRHRMIAVEDSDLLAIGPPACEDAIRVEDG
jgi:quercetin dioxygenase-like cupin family protein